MRRALLILVLVLFAAAVPGAQSASERRQNFDIENELVGLSSYGVFDFIGFDYDRGKVTLVGYTYQGSGVFAVDNQIVVDGE